MQFRSQGASQRLERKQIQRFFFRSKQRFAPVGTKVPCSYCNTSHEPVSA